MTWTFFIVNDLYPQYYYILNILFIRGIFFITIYFIVKILKKIHVFKSMLKESQAFENGFYKNRHKSISLLRRYQFFVFFLTFITYQGSIVLPSEYYLISNTLGFASLLLAGGYAIQSMEYISYIVRSKNPDLSGRRYFSFGLGMKKSVQVCAECVKTTLQLGFGLEMSYKLTHGGLNDISPPRQYLINHTVFPEKPNRVWSEASLGFEIQKRAIDSIPKTKN